MGQQACAVPPSHQDQLEAGKQGGQCRCIAGKSSAEFDAGKADIAGLGEYVLERSVGAEFGHIVVNPRDGADAEANTHAHSPLSRSSSRSMYIALAAATSGRREISGIATSHHAPPASVTA